MKTALALVGGITLAAIVGPARAADVPPSAPPPYYRAPAVAPVYNWSGFFIGGQGAYAFGRDAITLSGNAAALGLFTSGAIPGTIAADPRGALGGLEYGTNYQFGSFVFGTESDILFGDIKRSASVTTTGGGLTYLTTAQQKLNWFSTSRVRLGVAADNWLFYATGGLADARAEITVNNTNTVPGCAGAAAPCMFGNTHKTLWGWAAGGGIEYGMGPWSMKVEYLHYDLGDRTLTYADPTAPALAFRANGNFSGDMVRGGLNYRFAWTPWELIFGK